MKKLSKTRIEYCINPDGSRGYIWNPIVGCSGLGCPTKETCWAKKMNDRFHYVKDFSKPTLVKDAWDVKFPKKPSRILVGFMTDIMRPEVSDNIIASVRNRCRVNPQHTFLWLTKRPRRYSQFDFPQNCWLGVTINYNQDIYFYHKVDDLFKGNIHNLKWLSLEPYLDIDNSINGYIYNANWIVLGCQTNPYRSVNRKVIDQIIKETRKRKIPLWIKNKVYKAYPDLPKIQELLKGEV